MLAALLLLVVIVLVVNIRAVRRELAISDSQLAASETEANTAREQLSATVAATKKLVEEQRERMAQEIIRAEAHFQAEALQRQTEASEALADALRRLEALRHLEGVADAEGQAVAMLRQATEGAAAIRSDAEGLLQIASAAALGERAEATQRAKEVRQQADALLDQPSGRYIVHDGRRSQGVP